MELETKYKDKHPDVLATKRRIGELEKKIEASKAEREGGKR